MPIANASRLGRIWKVAQRHPLWRGEIFQINSHLSGEFLAEVRRFELLTPCTLSAQDAFVNVRISPEGLRLLGFQFIFVHQNTLEINSTAEVNAEVNWPD